MKIKRGDDCRYLDIDLTTRTWKIHTPSREDVAAFLGGKGLGIKIYFDRLKGRFRETHPLSENNLLIFSMGPLLGTRAPCSARFEVISRSPLTGLMAGSSCGGPFGEMCKTAGWDGIIISGKSPDPVILRIKAEEVLFEPAGALWGTDTAECQNLLNMDNREAAAVIGPAGENMVSYANICSGHRFAGRGGLGAVMGSKNLKAITAWGREFKCRPVMEEKFSRTIKKGRKYFKRNKTLNDMGRYGTNSNTLPGIKYGYLPVHNFRDRYHPEAAKLTGQTLKERYSTTFSGCRFCPILCGHKGNYPDGKVRQIPEYETMGMFGPNIENFDPDLIGEWNELMNRMGLDTVSTGGTFSWAMEAGEKGLRKTELTFGRTDNIARLIEDTAFKRNEGRELALGSRALADKYGGKDFAVNVKGLECPAYDPRGSWGQGLSYAVYNKGGCHLGSFLVGLEVIMEYSFPHTTLGKARWTIFFEDLYGAMNSLQTCLFTTFGIIAEFPVPRFVPPPLLRIATVLMPRVSQALMNWSYYPDLFHALTGIKMNKFGFLQAGRRIIILERWINCEMGALPEDDTLPERFRTKTATKFKGRNTAVPIGKMVRDYRKFRKYNPDGRPSTEALIKAGLRINEE